MMTRNERESAAAGADADGAGLAESPTVEAQHADAPPSAPAAPRSAEDRLRDHASIGRIADDLLPALIAKLSATALGEIEVREDAWKVRLRRPADALGPMYGRRATDRPGRPQPGHAGHGHPPGAMEPHRTHQSLESSASGAGPEGVGGTQTGHEKASGSGSPGSNGSRHQMTAVGPGPDPGARVGRMGHLPEGDEFPVAQNSPEDDASFRAVATSPAVGIFQSRAEGRPGTRVRAGDRIASVDVLGVAQPVLAPVDGLLGATLVENGDPVEYGQELVRIELPGASGGDGASPSSVRTTVTATASPAAGSGES